MEIRRLVWLLACLLNAENTFGVPIFDDYQGLTSVRDNIDPSVSVLICIGNSISIITKSDLNDKYPMLTEIYLDHNLLAIVERGCFKGTALKYISLSYNLLTVFSDFREVKDTLESINLEGNKIQKISTTEVDYLTKISNIVLSDNPLTQLPQLTLFHPSLIWLNLNGIELDCCSLTIWLKRKPVTLGLLMNIRPCSYPPEWNMTKWESITDDMLLQNTCATRSCARNKKLH
ncbi:hypothetical protein CAPTEDRAFT_217857 [Capitella teleta]|uniref:LRRCT domain-containing protein n=1 Tax=Capitella teleta TaxID=283909 RepID=R7VGP1_CAPTE|nr:hypothetical protein CAPTEDRAFT_217857 [Capitella teleta]|eukprot:ELU17717.1 hypothetical protein CAPTEDRAFT_217857 [Capitella teleta]